MITPSIVPVQNISQNTSAPEGFELIIDSSIIHLDYLST